MIDLDEMSVYSCEDQWHYPKQFNYGIR